MKKSILGGIAFFLTLTIIHAQGVNEKFRTQFTSYKIDNSKCVKLVHSSGSKIYIQDYAFGNQSNIEIRYREFITPIDMLVNNIPMTTKENGKTYQLESGGLFEIKAYQGEKELQLVSGKKIEVQLARGEGNKNMSKMEAFKMPDSFDGWNTAPNKVKNQSVGNDDELWGSSTLNSENEFAEQDWEDEWSDWCDDCPMMGSNEYRQQDSIKKVAFQTMEIDRMGFYNYDYKIENVNFIPIAADFKINQQETKNTIYVVYDDLNTVFYYPPYTWKQDFNLISGKNYRMFTIDKEGKIAQLVTKPNLKTIGDSFVFNLKKENKTPQSKEELASILQIQ